MLMCCHAQVIQPEQMQKGFQNLVQSVHDLQIDVPEAPDLVAKFVARAVVDDILPPAFVDKLPSGTRALLSAVRLAPPVLVWAQTANLYLLSVLLGVLNVANVTGSTTDPAVGSVKHKAEALLHSRHAAERMLRCWGSGAGLAFENTRDAIKQLIAVSFTCAMRIHCYTFCTRLRTFPRELSCP